jgi:hypothetical protein
MCYLCKDDGEYCQDCGKEICFDCKIGDDFTRPAYITSSGDLYCDRCGSRADEEEDYDPEMDFGDFDPYEISTATLRDISE